MYAIWDDSLYGNDILLSKYYPWNDYKDDTYKYDDDGSECDREESTEYFSYTNG